MLTTYQRPAKSADVAQLAERVLGKDEVSSSILLIGSILPCGDARAELRRRATDPGERMSTGSARVVASTQREREGASARQVTRFTAARVDCLTRVGL